MSGALHEEPCLYPQHKLSEALLAHRQGPDKSQILFIPSCLSSDSNTATHTSNSLQRSLLACFIPDLSLRIVWIPGSHESCSNAQIQTDFGTV